MTTGIDDTVAAGARRGPRGLTSALLGAVLGALLAACSGGSSPDQQGTPGDGSGTRVTDFEVQGTSQPPLASYAVIDAGENGGRFSVSWRVEGDTRYTAELLVSKDALPNTGNDIRFASFECMPSGSCAVSGQSGCRFGTDNHIGCGAGARHDLTQWFDRLPQDAYLLIRVCRGNSCSGQGAPVQFR